MTPLVQRIKEIVMARYNDTRTASGQATKKNSEYYIKLGYWDVDSEDHKVFISLPSVIFLDQLEPRQVNGEGDFAEQVCKGNDLLNEIRDGAKAYLEPGATKEVDLVAIVCRKKTSADASHKKVTRGIWNN